MTLSEFMNEWERPTDYISVKTSGSTGTPKEINISKANMRRSAEITCRFLGLHPGDTALLCMPLDYIAGKMVVVRSIVCQLQLISVPPSNRPLETLTEAPTFAAMVPSQVYAILTENGRQAHLLRQIKHLIIGGGAIQPELHKLLQSWPATSHVWSTYGMTETLSHIALRQLNGPNQSEWYTPFPSVRVASNAQNCLVISCPWAINPLLVTNDIAEVNAEGKFRILGRFDNIICTGGIKIQIEKVEQLLISYMDKLGIHDFAITSIDDKQYGQAIVLIYCGPREILVTNPHAREQIHDLLPQYHSPRYFVATKEPHPTTGTGKPARAAIKELAKKSLI